MLSAADIVSHLLVDRWRRNTCIPGWTPPSWWECDLFELTEAGYFREYEIKTSRGDFFADRRKKKDDSWKYQDGVRVDVPGDYKHDLLAAGCEKGPANFWYVAPEGLLAPADLPAWAGLIEIRQRVSKGRVPFLSEVQVVKAPRLHTAKSENLAGHVRASAYYRMHELRIAMRSRADRPWFDTLQPEFFI